MVVLKIHGRGTNFTWIIVWSLSCGDDVGTPGSLGRLVMVYTIYCVCSALCRSRALRIQHIQSSRGYLGVGGWWADWDWLNGLVLNGLVPKCTYHPDLVRPKGHPWITWQIEARVKIIFHQIHYMLCCHKNIPFHAFILLVNRAWCCLEGIKKTFLDLWHPTPPPYPNYR